MVRAGRVAVGIAAAVVLNGCAGAASPSADPAGSPTPVATAAPAPVKGGKAVAQPALDRAVAELREAGTGRVSAHVTLAAGGMFLERRGGSYYDLDNDLWESERTLQTNLTPDGTYTAYTVAGQGTEGRLYMTMRDNQFRPAEPTRRPTNELGRWQRFDTKVLDTSAEAMSLVWLLDQMKATKIVPRSNGGSTVTGQMAAVEAVGLLGNMKVVLTRNLTERRLAGTAMFTLLLNEEGLPVRLDLHGAGITFNRPRRVPLDLRQALAYTSSSSTFRLVGEKLTITLPKRSQKIARLRPGARRPLRPVRRLPPPDSTARASQPPVRSVVAVGCR